MSDIFTYEITDHKDDAQLRALMARNPVPGAIEVTYCREPDYFLGCGIMGDKIEVGACRRNGNEIVGIAQRSSRMMFYNGEPQRIGYLSQLRLDSQYWGQGLTRQGFAYGKTLHRADNVRAYITTIIELNKHARAILETPRDPFPHYHDIGRVYTLAMMLRQSSQQQVLPLPDGVTISRGGNLVEIVDFLNRVGSRKQFFYQYNIDDFTNGRLYDFDINDLFVARRNGQIIGTLGYWNQSEFKQTIITGYNKGMSLIKPFYNLYLRMRGMKTLPNSGEKLEHAYACLACIDGDDSRIFEILLAEVSAIAYQGGDAYLMIALHADDPMLATAQTIPHVTYRSRLYLVTWDDEDKIFYEQLDQRTPHIEIATL